MKLYDNYIDSIRNVIYNEKVHASKINTGNMGDYSADGIKTDIVGIRKSFSLKPLNSLEPLRQRIGMSIIGDQKLGEHPDFKHLKETYGSEYHYITSAFIDIKNSTGLYRRYDPDIVMEITNTIQNAAIHTCVVFGGYIQRLQGDGVFVYFGGKAIGKKESSINAINATSLFTYFVKNDLKKVFENEGIEDINTRIGIDFGDDDQVLWSVAGIGQCSEITTYSLHTSLASKMQGIANANGIVVGENVKSITQFDPVYFDWVKDSNGEIKKRYIFEDRDKGFYYKPWDFNWFNYLKSLPYIYQDQNGELYFGPDRDISDNARINNLHETTNLLGTGSAFTDSYGVISSNPSGVKNQEHRFHYE
jgi:adenylate cyclase